MDLGARASRPLRKATKMVALSGNTHVQVALGEGERDHSVSIRGDGSALLPLRPDSVGAWSAMQLQLRMYPIKPVTEH